MKKRFQLHAFGKEKLESLLRLAIQPLDDTNFEIQRAQALPRLRIDVLAQESMPNVSPDFLEQVNSQALATK